MTTERCNTDIELSADGDLSPTPSRQSRSTVAKVLEGLRLWCGFRSPRASRDEGDDVEKRTQVEDFPKGYPRFSALIAAHDCFHVFRRFSNVRIRLLLLAQDKVSQLEDKLNRIDKEETSPLFLACSRRDTNETRQTVLSELRDALAEYDDLLQRSSRSLAFEEPRSRHVSSLQNWHKGNACISREEAKFLERAEDLASLSSPDDDVVSWLEQFLSTCLSYVRRRPRSNISRDPHVHILSRAFTNRTTRAIIAPFVIVLVLIPVVICNAINSSNVRLAIMITSASVFAMSLSLVTKVKPVELAVATATYTTVLIVFITGPTGTPN